MLYFIKSGNYCKIGFSKDKKACKVTFVVSKEAAQGAKKVNIAE